MDEATGDGGEALPGELADRFTGCVELGRGAFGRVLKALDSRLGRAVALKLLNPFQAMDGRARARFEREAQLAARLTAPCFPRVFDFGVAGDTPFIVFELLVGRSLGTRIKECPGGLPEVEVLGILDRLLAALGLLHGAGILHRDVKPENLLLLEDGGVALIDLGLGVAPDSETLTRTGNLVGTPHYMCPAVIRGQGWSEASDLFAVGILGLEALLGRRPMVGPNLALTILRREAGPGAWLAAEGIRLGAPWDPVLIRAVDPDPARRPASALAMRRALKGEAESAPRPGTPAAGRLPAPAAEVREARPPGPERGPAVAPVLALAGLVGLAGYGLLGPAARGPDREPAEPPSGGSDPGFLAELRKTLEEDPEIRAAIGLEGLDGGPAVRETWNLGRARFRRALAEARFKERLAGLPAGPLPPEPAGELFRLARLAAFLGPVGTKGAPPLFEPDEDPGLDALLAPRVRAVEVPGLPAPRDLPVDRPATAFDNEYTDRYERAERGYPAWLAAGGGTWVERFDGMQPFDPARLELGLCNRYRVVNGLGRRFAWGFGKGTEMFTLGFSKTYVDRFEVLPGRLAFPLEPPDGDLVLAFHVEGLGPMRPGWLELEGPEANLGVLLAPARAPAGPGGDSHRLVLVRVEAGLVPRALRKATLACLGLQPIGHPETTVMIAHAWQHRGGPLPPGLGGN